MKKILLVAAIVIVGGLASIVITSRVLGPKLISVSAPTGQPIGEFDIPRKENSQLAVDVVVPLDSLARIANERIPREFEGADQKTVHERIKDARYAWKVARGDLAISNTGESLAFAAPFGGAAKLQAKIDASILTLPIDSDVELGGTIGGTLQPVVTPGWQIDPALAPSVQLTKAQLSLGQLGTVDASGLVGSSVGSYIQKEARKLVPAIRRKLAFRREIAQLWRQTYLSRPISDEPPVWLRVEPTGISATSIDYTQADRISFTVAVQSETFVTNRDPGVPEPRELPDLVTSPQPLATDLKIPLIVSVAELNQVLAGENIDLDTGIGTRIEISGMQAEIGQEGLLNLKLQLQADKSRLGRGVAGEIWVRARPVIDYEEQTLGFADVEFTVETRDKLTSAAAWLLEGLLIKGIEGQLRVDLDDYKEEIDEEVQKGLETANLPEGLDVSIENFDLRLVDIYTVTRHSEGGPDDPGVVVVVQATGDLETRITEKFLQADDESQGSPASAPSLDSTSAPKPDPNSRPSLGPDSLPPPPRPGISPEKP